MSEHIFTVSALTAAIRQRLEPAFPFVWVRGQAANLSRPASGHLYFSLRDEHSSLAAVWFKGNQRDSERFDPLTGEVYEEGPRQSLARSLEDGTELVCAGRVAVYGARGLYQLIVEFAQEAGIGRLHEEFERLREKLAGLGYFAPERKRPLPANARRVALLTSPGGAAVHDFLRLAENRGLGADIRLYPVPVQGAEAAPRMLRALERLQNEGWAEVVVLVRGGGSLEDLWAFNDPELARAIFTCPVPVLAGIGHEVDFTLADMTADARAATPSHAAQMLWPERAALGRELRLLDEALQLALDRAMERAGRSLATSARQLGLLSPARRIDERGQRLDSVRRLLDSAARLGLRRFDEPLLDLASRLRAASLRPHAAAALLEGLGRGLHNAAQNVFQRREHGLERLELTLRSLDPMAPLERGYALARKKNGAFVRAMADVAPGEDLRLMVRDGEIPVRAGPFDGKRPKRSV
ncbi:exodeoxyribonuclease VII large subunit [Desulfovibrio sp. OttesenSCG-928-G11]|nr:exodeoxyribonuclease VII large subunit [Desulfovibrio sp. OttesenSCG-928-G11]